MKKKTALKKAIIHLEKFVKYLKISKINGETEIADLKKELNKMEEKEDRTFQSIYEYSKMIKKLEADQKGKRRLRMKPGGGQVMSCKCKKDERERILKIIRDEIKKYKDYAKEYPQYWHPHNDALRFIAEEIEKDDK